jgi:hypothetical protein
MNSSKLNVRVAVRVTALCIGVFLVSLPLFSQGTAGHILGTITDQSGGAIADATVIVTDVDRNATRTLTTGSSGEYNAPNLLPGTYKVRVEAKGFKATERQNIIVEVGGELRVDLTVQPGEVTQTITVTEALPMVETTNATLGGTLQSQIIDTLPLNGRNFQNMLQLRPGVTIYPGGSGKTQSTNGQRPVNNVYLVNGVMASDPWVAQSVYGNVLAAGDQGTIMPVDAIDEFKIEENPRAEYGWKPGAIVNVGIKSGTNTIHGSAYAYGRETAFDARNYFNPVNSPNPTKQPVALEQFGGTLGGPIKKDKLFYFANFESQRYSIGNPAVITTPTQADLIAACTGAGALATPLSKSLAGLTSTCGIDAAKATTDPGGLAFQGLFPVNDGTHGGHVFPDLLNNNVINGGLGKVDYHPNDKHQLEGMYFFSQGDNTAADSPVSQLSNAWISAQHARAQVASGSWTWSPSSTIVNEARFGYGHNFWEYESVDKSQDPANYNFNGQTYHIPTGITNSFDFGAPRIALSGFCNFPSDCIGQLWPKIIGPTSVLQLMDHVSVIRGKHAFKFGGEIMFNRAVNNETAQAKGRFRFSGLTQFMEGTLSRAYIFVGDAKRDLTNQGYAGFLQDDWRVKPRLTVNLGLRYELNTVVHDRNGQQGNFDPVRGLVQSDNPYHGDHNNFSPRVGFAWDINGNGKTVLRAGGGILYETLGMDVLNGQGNLLGLRTIPTGLPLFNAGNPVPLPLSGNIQLESLLFTGAPLTTPGGIDAQWRSFIPGVTPVNSTTSLFAGVAHPACGDGFTNPGLPYAKAPAPCEIFGVDPNLRTAYVNNWNMDIQHAITNNVSIDIGYVGNHGTKLLGKLNHNQPPPLAGWTAAALLACHNSAPAYDNCITGAGLPVAGGANAEQAARPFTAPCAGSIAGLGAASSPGGPFNPTNACQSYLSAIVIVHNIYDSNYNGLQITLTARNFHGLTLTSGYTFSHALGMASDQGTSSNFPTPTDSYANMLPGSQSLRQQLYAATDFDVRHRFTLSLNYAIPGRKGYGQLLEGWSLNSIVIVTSGLPWGLSDASTDFSGTDTFGTTAGSHNEQWNFFGNPSDFTPVHGFTDTNGGTGGLPFFSGTSNATCLAKATSMGEFAVASLTNLGCYAVGSSILIPPAFGSYGTTPQNLWRDAGFKNVDMSVAKLFTIKERFKVQGRVEFFNILNKPDFSNPSGGPGGGIGDPSGGPPFGFSGLTPDTYSSNPQLGSGGARAIQLGMKLSW